ncbi:FIG002571: 4-hydroxybenzoyl-CoA thioesterase domain protein [hydrothermal vent metagenome]|uniref:FIG002571: 4-hydroxybenzoyl-CoA thioesterase domain protein n=1 Tax=hydrothermal vent metagenome TaxID=652676 RepID=A0A3B0ZNE7_9ZZZZ
MHKVTTEITIPFHDVDAMGVVWHGRYVKYLEVARCLLLDSFDYGYVNMRNSGYAWPVVDMRIKYVKPLSMDQIIVVEAEVVEWENRLKIKYLIRDKDSGVRLSKGYTVQMAVDMTAEELCFESPPILLKKLGIV